MGIEEDVYKIMHGIPCEPNIEPRVWENEYANKSCREDSIEVMKWNVEILKQDINKMKKQIQELKQNKPKPKYKVKVKKRKS